MFVVALAGAALAATPKDARATFDRLAALEQAFDPAVAELIADDATFVALRDGVEMKMTGTQYKAMIERSQAAAKESGDTQSYAKVKVKAEDRGFRVTAYREVTLKCYTDRDFTMRLEERDGQLLVVSSRITVEPLSQCPASPALAATLSQVRASLAGKLPLSLDEDTRLDSVDVEGPNLVYGITLVSVGAGDVDLQQLRPILAQQAAREVCVEGGPLHPVSSAGATVRYAYTLNDGTQVRPIDLSPATCRQLTQ